MRCQLDVEIELNELNEEIQNAKAIDIDISDQCSNAIHSQDLNEIRKEFLESPFVICPLPQYEQLLSRYYSLKCDEY